MKKLFTSIILGLLSVSFVFAQETSSKTVDYTGTSELELSVGLPTPQFSTAFCELSRGINNMSGLLNSFFGTGSSNTPVQRGKNTSYLPTFRLEYGYNLNKWLNIGGGAYYNYLSYPVVYSETGASAWTERTNTISIMANVRFYWYNHEIVRLYSGIGAGVGIVNSNMGSLTAEEGASMKTYYTFAMDVRLIGITVGKNLYGRFEVGVLGSGIVTAGIGYRF